MKHETTDLTLSPTDDELARNAALFFEADRLESFAYSLLEGDSSSAVSWERFTEAKALADAKRIEAQQDLLRIRGQLIISPVP
ncbi:hypothetical protein HDC30_005096 [Pseudomonas sp. JAI115]|uniref:hypothetical protein n=1 Tax=Pseudomonas sp. JAI115 TaxID=2723061 RepID=UPI001621E4F5|nr:hypothetical protein [Pseudomonas sp. JAI115]MBB6157844.1 hypothetical protein [Pseudomonas sp. JAI115]